MTLQEAQKAQVLCKADTTCQVLYECRDKWLDDNPCTDCTTRDALDMLTEAMWIVSRVATVGNLIGAKDVAEAEALLRTWEGRG